MSSLPPVVFTVYRTTCLANGKIYIGVHKTRDPNDAYLGSGSVLQSAILKHGRDQFTKEVLFIFETRSEAYAKEKELVTAAFAKRADTYNLMEGGVESPGWYDAQKGPKNSQYGKVWVWMEGEKPRKVRKEVVGEWMVLGWKRGRGPRFREKMTPLLSRIRPDPVGRIYVNHTEQGESLILPGDLEEMQRRGWVLGRACKISPEGRLKISKAAKRHLQGKPSLTKGFCWVHLGQEERKVSPEEAQRVTALGWRKGMAPRVWVCGPSGQAKRVREHELPKWLVEGWQKGRKYRRGL